MPEPTQEELKAIGKRILGQALKYDRKELKLAQEIAMLKHENSRLREELKRAKEEE
jgi:hypothetical protein